MPPKTETRAVETLASVAAVFEVLADPRRIPQWAPAFADQIRPAEGSRWTAVKDGQEFGLRAVVNEAAGTVDYLRQLAAGGEGGAYLRVVPRPGDGAVITMTLPLPPTLDPADTRAALEQELAVLVALVENS